MSSAAFSDYVRQIAWTGAFWRGEAAERFYTGIADAGSDLVDFTCTIADQISPFTSTHRSVLDQWMDWLRRVDCVPDPVSDDDLRDRIISILSAPSTAFFTGLDEVIRGYLPLVEVNDTLPAMWLPLEVSATASSNPWAVHVWHSAIEDIPETVRCVSQPFVPGVSEIVLLTPIATVVNPTGGSLAGDASLQWSEMRTTTELTVSLISGIPVDGQTLVVDPTDIVLVSDLLPLTGPGANVSGDTLKYSYSRTWAGDTRAVLIGQYTWP